MFKFLRILTLVEEEIEAVDKGIKDNEDFRLFENLKFLSNEIKAIALLRLLLTHIILFL